MVEGGQEPQAAPKLQIRGATSLAGHRLCPSCGGVLHGEGPCPHCHGTGRSHAIPTRRADRRSSGFRGGPFVLLILVAAIGASFWPMHQGTPAPFASTGHDLVRRVFVPLGEKTDGVDRDLAAFASLCATRAAAGEADGEAAARGVELADALSRLRERHAEWLIAYGAHLAIPEETLAVGAADSSERRRKNLLVEEGPVRQWQQELARARDSVAQRLRALYDADARLRTSRQLVSTEESIPAWKWVYLRFGPQAKQTAADWASSLTSLWEDVAGGEGTATKSGIASSPCSDCRGSGRVSCAACGGRGTAEVREMKTCDQCGGTGRYRLMSKKEIDCQFCRGRGKIEKSAFATCSACGGTRMAACARCAGTGKVDSAK